MLRHAAGWFFILLCTLLCAQPAAMPLHLLNAHNGLSLNSSTAIEIDSAGFIWVGTQDGLNRFDGKNIRIFRNRDQQGLPGDYIYTIVSKGDSLFVSTDRGVAQYQYSSQRFRFIPELKKQSVKAIIEYRGSLLLACNDGLYYPNGTPSALKYPKTKGGVLLNLFRINTDEFIYQDIQNIWVWNPHTNHHFKLLDSFENGAIHWNGKQLCAGNSTGQFYSWTYHEGKFVVDKNDQFDCRISSICQTSDGIYAGTNKGLLYIGDTSYYIQKDRKSNFRLPDDDINKVKCKGDLILVSTHGGGACYGFPARKSIELYQPHVNQDNSVFDAFIHDFVEDDDGILWVASHNGIMTYDRFGQTRNINQINTGIQFPYAPIRSFALGNNQLLIATGGEGLLLLNNLKSPKITKQFKSENEPLLPGNYIYHVHVDKQNRAWLTTSNGVALFDLHQQKFVPLPDSLSTYLKNVRTWKLAETEKGEYLFSCMSLGILYFHPEKQIYRWLKIPEETGMFDIYPDAKRRIWIAGQHGFYQMDYNGNIQRHYSDTNGIPSKVCYGILEDENGFLWVSCNNGIFRYNPENEEVKTLGIEDGLQDVEFNQEAFLKEKDGSMLFGGVNGFNRIHPKTIRFEGSPAHFYFSKFSLDGQDTSSDLATIQLPTGKHSLQLAYNSIHYLGNSPYQAFYRLSEEGDWLAIEEGKTLFIDQLPMGHNQHFAFRVIDGNGQEVFSKTWELAIPLPLYQRGWFQLIVLALIFLVTYGVYRYLLRENRKQLQTQTQIAELKMRSLRAQMNPHFLFNSMNSIQHLVLQGQSDEAFHYLSGFSRLLRLILETSDQPVTELENEIELIRLYVNLEKLRFDKTLEAEIIVEDGLETDNWTIPGLMIQPYVENAIWHGLLNKPEGRLLRIEFKEDNGELLCVVEDNGIGRVRAREIKSMRPIQYESKGMSITEARLELLGKQAIRGKVDIIDLMKNGVALGTRVEIRIPVEAKKYD